MISARGLFGAIGFTAFMAAFAAVAEAKTWSVTVKGQIVWKDGSDLKPLVGARVTAWDRDTEWDDEIGSGTTDSEGRFSISGKEGDPEVVLFCDETCSKPDVYVEVELESSKVVVQNELGINWTAKSDERENKSGTIDFGMLEFEDGDAQGASILFGKAIEQYAYFYDAVGDLIPRHDGRIGVYYPAVLANGVPWTTEESVHWPGGYDDWNAMYHEFGHRVRHAKDGNFDHFLADVVAYEYLQHHWYDKETNEGFAFNEGWAEYFSTILDSAEQRTFQKWEYVEGGDSVEGNVAKKLYTQGSRCGFEKLWKALSSASIHSYDGFKSALCDKYSACCLTKVEVGKLAIATGLSRKKVSTSTQEAGRAALVKQAAAWGEKSASVWAPDLKAPSRTSREGKAVRRIISERRSAMKEWGKAVGDALEKALAKPPTISLATAKGGSYRSKVKAARALFLKAAAESGLRFAAKMKALLKRERSNGKSVEGFTTMIDDSVAKIARWESALESALSDAQNGSAKIPRSVLPRWFAHDLRAAKGATRVAPLRTRFTP